MCFQLQAESTQNDPKDRLSEAYGRQKGSGLQCYRVKRRPVHSGVCIIYVQNRHSFVGAFKFTFSFGSFSADVIYSNVY